MREIIKGGGGGGGKGKGEAGRIDELGRNPYWGPPEWSKRTVEI